MARSRGFRIPDGYDDLKPAFDAARAGQSLRELLGARATLAADIRTRVAAYRRQVDEQYDRLLRPWASQTTARAS